MEKLTNIFRRALTIASESILHPTVTSTIDEKGRVISRGPAKKTKAPKA